MIRCGAALLQVISTSGDTHLGGEDFDHRVMDYFIKLIKKKHKTDISKDSRALQKLRREAERAKRALSSQHQARRLCPPTAPVMCSEEASRTGRAGNVAISVGLCLLCVLLAAKVVGASGCPARQQTLQLHQVTCLVRQVVCASGDVDDLNSHVCRSVWRLSLWQRVST